MYDFRTKGTHERYQAARAAGHLEQDCPLCTAPSLHDFRHWRLITNEFPYDAVAHTHHMLIPRRHVSEVDVNPEEAEELQAITRGYCNEYYQYILESLSHKKSIPAHHHLHLLIAHPNIRAYVNEHWE